MPIASLAEREQISGLLDELLALLIQLQHPFLGMGPAVDEADHRLHQTTKEGTALEALATQFVAAEFIHQIITSIFQIAGDRRDDLQHLIDICAYRSFPCPLQFWRLRSHLTAMLTSSPRSEP